MRLVALFTVIVPMVTPGMGLSMVVPWTKFVFASVMVYVPEEPRGSVLGLMTAITGAPAGRNWLKAPRRMGCGFRLRNKHLREAERGVCAEDVGPGTAAGDSSARRRG